MPPGCKRRLSEASCSVFFLFICSFVSTTNPGDLTPQPSFVNLSEEETISAFGVTSVPRKLLGMEGLWS